MSQLSGKTVLITGASRGIGRAIASKMAAEGANVAFTYLSSEERAKALEAELGGNAKGFKSDAGDFAQAEKLVGDVIGAFGQIDVLVNNAGITRDNLMLRMSEDQWDEVMTTNLKSAFNLTKHVTRPMMKARAGSIINITSIVGVRGNAGQTNYAASKAGMIGLTKSVAQELGSRNIRCNAIAPGFIETEMTGELSDDVKKSYLDAVPLNRFGKSEEVADLVTFLGSERSAYITGQVISICGGLLT